MLREKETASTAGAAQQQQQYARGVSGPVRMRFGVHENPPSPKPLIGPSFIFHSIVLTRTRSSAWP